MNNEKKQDNEKAKLNIFLNTLKNDIIIMSGLIKQTIYKKDDNV